MRSLRTWSEASSSCRAQNGKLAEISSLEIDSWISQKSAGRIWFSATDTKVEGKWTNEDGTELTPFFTKYKLGLILCDGYGCRNDGTFF